MERSLAPVKDTSVAANKRGVQHQEVIAQDFILPPAVSANQAVFLHFEETHYAYNFYAAAGCRKVQISRLTRELFAS